MNIDRLLEKVFPDGVWSGEEYVIRCLYCGDGSHNHLYLNPEKRIFYCFRCEASGPLSLLLKKEGIDAEDYHQVYRTISRGKEFVPRRFHFWDFESLVGDYERGHGREAQTAWEYLVHRRMTREEIIFYHIRYSTEGRYNGRVIFPVFEPTGRQVVCWIARSFLSEIPKYTYPKRGESLKVSSSCVFGIQWARQGFENVVITEGVFDALAVNRSLGPTFCGVSILGKRLHAEQRNLFLRIPPSVAFYVLLDPDAEEESRDAAQELALYGRKVYEARLPVGGDPDSVSRAVLVRSILDSKITLPAIVKRRKRRLSGWIEKGGHHV